MTELEKIEEFQALVENGKIKDALAEWNYYGISDSSVALCLLEMVIEYQKVAWTLIHDLEFTNATHDQTDTTSD